MLNQLNASPSTVYYELNLLKLLEKHSKQEKSSLALNISKNYFKTKKETCKESGTELKKAELCNFVVYIRLVENLSEKYCKYFLKREGKMCLLNLILRKFVKNLLKFAFRCLDRHKFCIF